MRLAAFAVAVAALLAPGAAAAAVPAPAPVAAAPAAGRVGTDIVRDYEYWLGEYGFTTAWNSSRGEGQTVAVIDTGVVGSVAELDGVVVDGTDVSGVGSSDGQTPVGDQPEHGTMVASLLAGRGSAPGSGVIGVAPAAKLLSISVAFGQDTGSTVSTDDQIAEAVRWAVDHGADVINMSLTRNTRTWPESWDDAFGYAFANDVVVVAAAGNRGSGTTEVGAPATIPGVLAVAGVDRDKNASFDASSQGITIGVSAPSEKLVGVKPDGQYLQWDGTSAATPLVSGLVALVRAAYPDLDANNVIQRVIATADPRGHDVPSPLYGYGIIDPPAALTEQVDFVQANPLGDLGEWIRIHRRAEIEQPEATEQPEEEVVPIADPPLPRNTATLTLWPTPWTLAYITLPLSIVAGFGTLAALLGIGAVRHIRRTARSERQ
ncbi:S8 family serine peptidase [Agromyces archimandritae]|uniref:S8 family serine peptidase n=2 Tax=Agromyces archimandritae TaxID=2781962 RepID=A0A975FPT3_9MICO|nr:S8 family serine peptidase [Agromyces archimandritae]